MQKKLIAGVLAAFVLGAGLLGQSSLPDYPLTFRNRKYQTAAYVSSTPAALATRDTVLLYLRFSNDDASATGTIRVIDGTTSCGGAGCPIVPDVTIAPKTMYVIPLAQGGEFEKGGITWSVTGSTKVVGYVQLQY